MRGCGSYSAHLKDRISYFRWETINMFRTPGIVVRKSTPTCECLGLSTKHEQQNAGCRVQITQGVSAFSKRSLPTASKPSHGRSIAENAAELGCFFLETLREARARLRGIIAKQGCLSRNCNSSGDGGLRRWSSITCGVRISLAVRNGPGQVCIAADAS